MKCPNKKMKFFQDVVKGLEKKFPDLSKTDIEDKAFSIWRMLDTDEFAAWYGNGEKDFAGNPLMNDKLEYVNDKGEAKSMYDLRNDPMFDETIEANETEADSEKQVQDYDKLISKIKDVLTKKIQIYKNSNREEHRQALIDLRKELEEVTSKKAISLFAKNALSEVKNSYFKFKALEAENMLTIKALTGFRNYVSAYDLLDEVKYALMKNNDMTPEDRNSLNLAIEQRDFLKAAYKDKVIPLVAKELSKRSVFSTEAEIESYLHNAPFDVSGLEKWLDFVGDSKDAVLPLIAKLVDNALQDTRKEHIKFRHKLIDLTNALAESKGNPSRVEDLFHEMLERDINGKLTGHIVSEYRTGEFTNEMNVFRDKLNAIEDKNSDEFKKAKKEYYKWLRENTVQQYLPAYYNAMDKLSDQAREARDKFLIAKQELIKKYRTKHKTIDVGNVTDEDWAKIRELQKGIDQLKNLFYEDGTKKSGKDLAIAKELKAFADTTSALYERVTKDGKELMDWTGFNKSKRIAEEKGEEEYRKWRTRNTKMEFTDSFWNEFNDIMSVLRNSDEDIQKINEEINSILREFKDENGIVNGEMVPPALQQKVKDLTEDKRIIQKGNALHKEVGDMIDQYSIDQQEAKERLNALVEFSVTPYYDKVYEEMEKIGGKKFEDWFKRNHTWNFISGQWEANRIWTIMMPKNQSHIKLEHPNNHWFLTQVKKEFWNPEYTDTEGNVIGLDNRGYALPTKKWRNNQYTSLINNSNKAIVNYYNYFRENMKVADDNLPSGYRLNTRLPSIRKKLMERMMDNNGENAVQILKESVKDKVVRRGDDRDFGQLLTESNEALNYIPVHFTNKIDVKEMSFNLTSLLSSFYYMSANHSNLSKVIDTIEGAKFLVGERTFNQTDSMMKVMKNKLKGLENDIITKEGKTSNAYAQIEKYLNMVVYGQMNDDLGFIDIGIAKLDKAKLADTLGGYTAYSLLGLNLIAATLNVAQGESMNWTDAFAGEFFTVRSYGRANIEYDKNIMSIVADVGKQNPASKIGLLNEYLDTLGKYEEEVMHGEANTTFKRFLKNTTPFFLSNMGEHMMQSKVMMAMLMNTKPLDVEGNEIEDLSNMYDAYTVKDGKLVLDPRVANFDEELQKSFTRRMQFLIRRMHGNYNKKTAAMWQANAYLRLIGAMRKWVMPGFNRRYESKRNNEFGEVVTEGFYRTTARFLWQVMKDLKSLKADVLKADWNNLSEVEKMNIKRTITEVGLFMVALAASSVLYSLAGGDDKDKRKDHQGLLYAAYVARRLRQELTFYINPISTLQILRSPAASMSVIEAMVKLIGQMQNPTERYEVGDRKGEYKIWKKVEDITPFYKHYRRAFTPEGLNDQWSWLVAKSGR